MLSLFKRRQNGHGEKKLYQKFFNYSERNVVIDRQFVTKSDIKLGKSNFKGEMRSVPNTHKLARDNRTYQAEKFRNGAPLRFEVPDERVSWSESWSDYNPPEFTDSIVYANDRLKETGDKWADPEDFYPITQEWLKRVSQCGDISKLRFPRGTGEYQGLPRNPVGRTGMAGRGLLGKWGPNQAVDNIITCRSPVTGELHMVAVKREDTGEWAIPGGMIDDGEYVTYALKREFKEEAVATPHMEKVLDEIFRKDNMQVVYRGYVDDPRNTDHAWMETTAIHCHCSSHLAARLILHAGTDAIKAAWICIDLGSTDKRYKNLYADHKKIVDQAVKMHRNQKKEVGTKK